MSIPHVSIFDFILETYRFLCTVPQALLSCHGAIEKPCVSFRTTSPRCAR